MLDDAYVVVCVNMLAISISAIQLFDLVGVYVCVYFTVFDHLFCFLA